MLASLLRAATRKILRFCDAERRFRFPELSPLGTSSEVSANRTWMESGALESLVFPLGWDRGIILYVAHRFLYWTPSCLCKCF